MVLYRVAVVLGKNLLGQRGRELDAHHGLQVGPALEVPRTGDARQGEAVVRPEALDEIGVVLCRQRGTP